MARIDGTDRRDRLTGTDAADEFYAGAGNDRIIGGGGDDIIDAGEGNDSAVGGYGNDSIFGGADDDALRGGAGDDGLEGGDGNDRLDGGIGRDHLSGGEGDDYLVSGAAFDRQSDILEGGNGNDYLEFYRSAADPEPYIGHGGDGDDTIGFSQSTGGRFQFFGDGGKDRIFLYGMADGIADGGDGLDFVTSISVRSNAFPSDSPIDFSALWVSGEISFGTLTLRGFEQIGDITFGSYSDNISQTVIVGDMPGAGESLPFRLFLRGGDDRAYGGSADEWLFGEDGDDLISAGAGNDYIDGGSGNDQIFGSDGDDTIYGSDGDDRITGGAGVDTLSGIDDIGRKDTGDDLFIFREGDTGATLDTADTIRNFFDGDRISLKLIDANTITGADDAFTFIGNAAFSGVAGELRFANGVIEGDTDGNGIADLMIKVGGSHAFVATDFQL